MRSLHDRRPRELFGQQPHRGAAFRGHASTDKANSQEPIPAEAILIAPRQPVSIYRPSKSPYYHYDFVFDGVRHHGSTGCKTKRDAEQVERQKRHEATLPSKRKPTITVDEACGLYQEHAESQTSWKTTEYLLQALVTGLGPNRHLADIGQRDLQLYFAARQTGRANSTINREIDNARAVWRHAERSRFDIGEMPDWRSLRRKVAERPPRELSREGEEDRLLAALPADALDVVQFTLLSGWRRQEVIGLRWSDCELIQARARTRIKGGNVVVRALSPSLVAIIKRQPQVTDHVFTYLCRKSRGKRRKGDRLPMTATALRRRFDEARAASAIPDFRFHDLRHTAATRVLRATQNLAVTREVLKHSNIKTTLRYAHVLEDDVRHALQAAESRNSPGPEKKKTKKNQEMECDAED